MKRNLLGAFDWAPERVGDIGIEICVPPEGALGKSRCSTRINDIEIVGRPRRKLSGFGRVRQRVFVFGSRGGSVSATGILKNQVGVQRGKFAGEGGDIFSESTLVHEGGHIRVLPEIAKL